MHRTNNISTLFNLGILFFVFHIADSSNLQAEDHYITASDTLAVIQVDIIGPSQIIIEDGADSKTYTVSIQPNKIQATDYEWTWSAPTDAANNPQLTFSFADINDESAAYIPTVHWFAYPPDPCECELFSIYDINCEVSVDDTKCSDPTPEHLMVNVPNPAGETWLIPLFQGLPSMAYDSSTNLWKVTGPGNLIIRSIDYEVYVHPLSQFYEKVYLHEQEHVDQFTNGHDGHQYFSLDEFYLLIQNLTAQSAPELISKIGQAYSAYYIAEMTEIELLEKCSEYRAYEVSDPIHPQYLLQNCQQFTEADCQ